MCPARRSDNDDERDQSKMFRNPAVRDCFGLIWARWSAQALVTAEEFAALEKACEEVEKYLGTTLVSLDEVFELVVARLPFIPEAVETVRNEYKGNRELTAAEDEQLGTKIPKELRGRHTPIRNDDEALRCVRWLFNKRLVTIRRENQRTAQLSANFERTNSSKSQRLINTQESGFALAAEKALRRSKQKGGECCKELWRLWQSKNWPIEQLLAVISETLMLMTRFSMCKCEPGSVPNPSRKKKKKEKKKISSGPGSDQDPREETNRTVWLFQQMLQPKLEALSMDCFSLATIVAALIEIWPELNDDEMISHAAWQANGKFLAGSAAKIQQFVESKPKNGDWRSGEYPHNLTVWISGSYCRLAGGPESGDFLERHYMDGSPPRRNRERMRQIGKAADKAGRRRANGGKF